jgi:cobyrinic acid a,c-diamide synthase
VGVKKGVLIAGTHSGVGKTTVTLAILEALVRRGMSVQSFKVGPDYLDPAFHEMTTGRPSRNLDGWMMGKPSVLNSFDQNSRDADFSVVEGVMGLFDGLRGRTEEGSSAQIAKWLSLPVVLVLDAKGLARTAGALVLGIQLFDPRLRIQGVIFNRIGSQNHLDILKESVESTCKIKVLGGIPAESSISIPERHLGLVQARECLTLSIRTRLAELAEKHLDLEHLLETEILSDGRPFPSELKVIKTKPKCKIAVARDEAFNFYYQDNLDLLENAGAKLVFFSPLHDPLIPEADSLYFVGGYPELHTLSLSQNSSMLASLQGFAKRGGPIYGECGGLMYFSKTIETVDGKIFPMAGLLPVRVKMGRKLKALGYREVVSRADNLLFQKGDRAKGHEYHYSEWFEESDGGLPEQWPLAYHLFRGGETSELKEEGFAKGSVLASYIHLHFASYPDLAARWISACEAFRGR